MNLREAVEAYANAVSIRDYYNIIGDGKQEAESVARLAVCSQSLDVVLAVAEAAMAYAEYQASNSRVEAKDYFCEQRRLWRAFMDAHKAAKAANQS